MISKIKRELRQKRMRSAKTWQRAQQKKRRLERKLGRVEDKLKADRTFNCEGIVIAVHHLRSQFGKAEVRFEFFRKDRRGPATDLGESDLDALIRAAKVAQRYRAKWKQKVGLEIFKSSSFAR